MYAYLIKSKSTNLPIPHFMKTGGKINISLDFIKYHIVTLMLYRNDIP